ncbi:Histone superfamily protein [Prunus dulcis]|uniref:Histone superfamily protein n=1 Tax=Prunus dulcis TaxID=3755 RepID=A0A4Y1QV84_PRUDU|nr:Histone superfamily protein [Prunus dulcis]
MLFWPCRRQPRHTLLGCLRTQTSVPFMPSALLSCPRTSNLPGEFEARGLKEELEATICKGGLVGKALI